jgi:hypothetical protein
MVFIGLFINVLLLTLFQVFLKVFLQAFPIALHQVFLKVFLKVFVLQFFIFIAPNSIMCVPEDLIIFPIKYGFEELRAPFNRQSLIAQ